MGDVMSGLKVGCWLVCLLLSVDCSAADFIEWQSSNVQLLGGEQYELGRAKRQIVSIEHANTWRYGDFHFFSDITLNDDVGAYAEITPRFSLSRMGLLPAPGGLIQDTFIATNFEFGKYGVRRYLYGAGFNLALLDFAYFKVNVLHRNNPQLAGTTGQLTLAWKKVFDLGPTHLIFEGFADFAGSEGSAVANQLLVPRFLLDLGEPLGTANRLFVGIEWQYWRNKFGRPGVTESVPQLQIKLQL